MEGKTGPPNRMRFKRHFERQGKIQNDKRLRVVNEWLGPIGVTTCEIGRAHV